MLKVKDVDVFYGELQVLHRVNLEVKKGEIIALIGSNGSGKTTLFRAISGLLPIVSGSIEFEGGSINKLPPEEIVKKGIVQVPEGRALFLKMTVEENLSLGAYTVRDKTRKQEILNEVYALFPILKQRRNQLAGTLSGGEAQMLAIGRALMADPKLLLLDEPSFGLAPMLVLEVLNTIRRINKERGLTVLLAEQNVHLALGLCDRGYVIANGTVELEGSSEKLKNDEKVKKVYLGIT
jgi:branched-chain amino acid transport system ATP-binding protein